MRTTVWCLGLWVALAALAAGSARADVLVRIDETTVKGIFKGGSDAALMFEVGGQIQQVNFGDVMCLVFTARTGAAAAPSSGAAIGTGPTTLLRADGGVVKGVYKGGTDAAVLFEVKGTVQQINLADIRLIINEHPAAKSPAATTAAPTANAPVISAPATAATAASGVAPTGTKVLVALTQDVTTASHAKGAIVEGALAAPLTVGGNVLAPEGTKVWGKVSESRGGKVVGGSYIMFSFTEIQIGNERIPMETSAVGAEGGKGGTARKVGAGALIGAAAGDAGAGAAVGGAVALLAAGGKHIRIPKGTKAEVTLSKDLKIGQ
jgi:hypothetical protein